jgi:uncharacterized membrane protein (DUF4010 family)
MTSTTTQLGSPKSSRPAKELVKAALTLALILAVAFVFPNSAVDPWNVLNPRKIAQLIFVLTLVQALGTLATNYLGLRLGSLVAGFLGGLMSSTLVTASVARTSRGSSHAKNNSAEVLTFLAATAAMISEGILIVLVGTEGVKLPFVLVFLGPLIATWVMILYRTRESVVRTSSVGTYVFEVYPIIKLALFIVVIIALSKAMQIYVGQAGVFTLTFLVSLFELHGSVISSLQLYNAGNLNTDSVGGLLALSMMSAFISKIILVSFLGSWSFKIQVLKCSLPLFISLAAGWLAFVAIRN